MKRITALVLALIMLLSLAGCGLKAEKIVKEDSAAEQTESKKQKTYEEMSLEEKLEYKSGLVWDEIEPTDSGLLSPAKSAEGENWGYINSKGEWKLEPVYSFAYPFNYGYATVLENFTDYLFIDTAFNKALTLINRNTIKAVSHFSDGYACVSLDTGYAQTMQYIGADLITMLDASILPKTSGVKYETTRFYMTATSFVNGNAVVMRRTNADLIEKTETTRENLENKGLYQSAYVIDLRGQIKAELPKGYDIDNKALDENDRIIVRNMKQEDALYGLCDINGDIIVSCVYRRILHAQGELYAVCNQNGFWGYIDKNGNKVVDYILSDALPFTEGYAAVCENDCWGIINTKGEYVIEPVWDEVCSLKITELDSITADGAVSENLAALRYGTYWALVNMKGELVAVKKCETKEAASPFLRASKGLVVFSENGLCGLMTSDGSISVKPQFGNIGIFN